VKKRFPKFVFQSFNFYRYAEVLIEASQTFLPREHAFEATASLADTGGALQVDPRLESAWFQPSRLKCDILVSKFAFSSSICTATPRALARRRLAGGAPQGVVQPHSGRGGAR
jgi:hypothetical protein